MKRKNILTAIAVLIFSIMLSTFSMAADVETVYVTVSDENGKTVLAMKEVAVTDIDGDGVITIDEALNSAHELFYEGGAAAGYGSEKTEYGLSLTKLWGCENGGSYGYYLNDATAMSLTDPVKSGDRVNAFVYTDTATYSDTYAYFDITTATVEAGENIDLTLKCAGYDENWMPISIPCADAEIIITDSASGIKTDAEGKASVIFDTAGTYIISAKSANTTLVPPICIIEVTAAETEDTAVTEAPVTTEAVTGNNASAQTGDLSVIVSFALIASAVMNSVIIKRKYANK